MVFLDKYFMFTGINFYQRWIVPHHSTYNPLNLKTALYIVQCTAGSSGTMDLYNPW